MVLSTGEKGRLIRKAMGGCMDADDQMAVMDHLDELYFQLDRLDEEDFFGTEGWRHFLGLEE